MQIIVISTTVSSESAAKSLAKSLLSAKIAACVKIIPSQSIYLWNNSIEESTESILLIKTLESAKDEVYKHIKLNSTYELPELISFNATASSEYFSWVTECLN